MDHGVVQRVKTGFTCPKTLLKKITIVHSRIINRISFESETQTCIVGEECGITTDTAIDIILIPLDDNEHKSRIMHDTFSISQISIGYSNEYLTSISGSFGRIYDDYGGFTIALTSICFQTNQIRHGPYGRENLSRFSYDCKDEVIVGFHGRASMYIDAIGIYVNPKSQLLFRNSAVKDNSTHESCYKMSGVGMPREAGPWGDGGGKPWDDVVFSNVKQVRVYVGESLKVIHGVQFEYVKRDGKSVLSQVHRGTGGNETLLGDFDDTEEYLSGISRFYGPVKEFNGLEGIASITFHTNKKMYGPYGEESGVGYVNFTSTASPGKVVGFHGRSGDFLTAIGVHMEYI